VSLSQSGEALLPEARRVLRDAGVARDAVAAVRGVVRGRLRIGLMVSLALIDGAALFTTFHRAHPDVVIEPRPAPGGAATLANRVRDGELDLAFTWQPEETAHGLRVAKLASEPFVLIAPASRRLPRGELIVGDLGSTELVRAGFGIAIMPKSQVGQMSGLTSRFVTGLPKWGVSLIAPAERPLTAAAAFARLVCTTFGVALSGGPGPSKRT
jgi:DNA-binding transcriptional LysR family regulator